MSHSTRRPARAILIGGGLMLATLACLCGPLQRAQEIQGTVGAASTAINQSAPTFEALATEIQMTLTAQGSNGAGAMDDLNTAMAVTSGGQWASSATASSQYGDIDWSASQATGAPNTPDCDDHTSAWASQGKNTQETLTLKYAIAVVPTAIVIYHTYNPGSVVKVDVSNANGGALTVFQGQPGQIAECPYQQTIEINVGSVTSPVDTVIISLDQSVIGNWDEIDAVELVGAGQ